VRLFTNGADEVTLPDTGRGSKSPSGARGDRRLYDPRKTLLKLDEIKTETEIEYRNLFDICKSRNGSRG